MTELKTLKDIRRCGEFEDDINPSELKAEAVKWIKHLKDYQNRNEKDLGDVSIEINGEISFINYFSNLTEEDLKEEKEN